MGSDITEGFRLLVRAAEWSVTTGVAAAFHLLV